MTTLQAINGFKDILPDQIHLWQRLESCAAGICRRFGLREIRTSILEKTELFMYVQDDQLLLGRAGCDGRYGILYPELDGDFLDIAVRDLPTHSLDRKSVV